MKITFKPFLEATFKKNKSENLEQVEDDELSYHEQLLSEAAKMVVGGGFRKNFMDGLEHGWLYRGAERYEDHFEVNDSFSMCFVDTPRPADRESTFSGSQFCSNFWHVMGLPSRRRCVMASPNMHMASDFSTMNNEAHIIIPKDGTPVYQTPDDWNLSFEKEIASTLDVDRIGLGLLSPVFLELRNGIAGLTGINGPIEFEEYEKYLNKVNTGINSSIGDFKKFFKSSENVLNIKYPNSDKYILSEITIGNLNIPEQYKKIIKRLMKLVRSGENLFVEFEHLFEKIKGEITTSKTPSKLINIHGSNASPEIWWTSDSLVFRGKYTKVSKTLYELKDYIEKEHP